MANYIGYLSYSKSHRTLYNNHMYAAQASDDINLIS